MGMEVVGLAWIAISLMVFAIALIYMFSQMFKRPEWEALAKQELYQVFVSTLILLFISGTTAVVPMMALNITDSLATDLPAYVTAGGDAPTLEETAHCHGAVYHLDYDTPSFCIARVYLNKVAFTYAVPVLIQLRSLALATEYISGLTVKIGTGNFGMQFPLNPGYMIWEHVINFLIIIAMPFTSSLIVQQVGLEVIRATMFSIILPTGLFLRVFPQTRDVGSFLIATSFGFFIIFPLTYVMHYQIMSYLWAVDSGTGYTVDYNTQEYQDMGATAVLQELELTPYGITHIFNAVDRLAYLIVQAVFLPAFSLVLTTSFIRATIKFLSQKLG